MVHSGFDAPFQRPPSHPEQPLKQRKELLWQQMSHELSQITDGLGKGIDSGIMDTVVSLSVLGVPTRQSCEGHLKWSTGAPWVDVEAVGPKVEELEKKLMMLGIGQKKWKEIMHLRKNLDRFLRKLIRQEKKHFQSI